MSHSVGLDPQTWVDEYGDYLYRYAYSRLRDANAAEEVLQETFFAGVRAQHQYSGKGSERGWLLTILKRKIVDYIRMRNKHAGVRGGEDPDPTTHLFDQNGNWKDGAIRWNSPDHAMESRELRSVVEQCLTHLPASQADVFTLSVMEEMPSEEICKELNITPSNFWVRLHRARIGLAKCVGTKWFQGEGVPTHAK